ncbi:MAG: glycosyltransferase [Nitrospirae bacterium]|nr:glycosyltransferase [Nitrospirota bacterium]
MRHLIFCSEYPPAPIPPGGVGTYVLHISRLLAEAGETVHVVAPRWEGAPRPVEELCGGRLIVHRVSCDEPLSRGGDPAIAMQELRGLLQTDFSRQSFSWQAGLLAEALVDEAGIDLIESQDYDAPLYYFLLRRSLGLGPKRHPPCIIHLHSPTEFIYRHNEYDAWRPEYLTAKRLEDYCIAAADALRCPSHYLTGQAAAHYGLDPNSITVLRLPLGDTPVIARAEEVWADGGISYFGRLEPRKGVIEWVDAVVSAAADFPMARFDFVGADLPHTAGLSVRQYVERQIPNRLKPQFHFHGSRPRAELFGFMKQTRIAVVPSRWENFPYSCAEAMCSGLPVIASPEGGMAEMIKDGQTGWIAENAQASGLARALRRALATPPMRLAAMGRLASEEIRRMCDNKKIVEDQLKFHHRVAGDGANRSLKLPVNLPWTRQPLADRTAHRVPKRSSDQDLAFIVNGFSAGPMLADCLQSLERQTRAPRSVVLVVNPSERDATAPARERAHAKGWWVCELSGRAPAEAKNLGVETVLSSGPRPAGCVFLDAADRLHPGFTETCEAVLRHRPEVGIVSPWVQWIGEVHRFVAHPCPAFPYQLLSDESVSAAVIRTEALREAVEFRAGLNSGFEQWDLVNAVMASGWAAVTVPRLLAERVMTYEEAARLANPAVHSRMRRVLLARFPEVVARDAQPLVHLLESRMFQSPSVVPPKPELTPRAASGRTPASSEILRSTLSQQGMLVRKALRDPKAALRFVLRAGAWLLRTIRRESR